ncbi:glycine cleavage system protein GcvH [Novosphingobium sp. FSY-8]|uniref:Glycine cleavage system H protein n=1 Tax=Novosphingobium ovatum TaxID=1908523 RepID=A0ABW9XAZ9_9SPHN|nr:glycine cleavage system protein GcvH [Novosphingobium ovatum]NBC35720.1 glycine cleavage system protein GcvH [Novosphingobium ovatum]
MTVLYTADHEWIAFDGEATAGQIATVGITAYAQHALGDITYVDLPAVGGALTKAETAGAIDSVKAASDIYAPVSGEVSEVNEALADAPELVNSDPQGTGWLWRQTIADPADLAGLMDETAYQAHIEGL